MSTGFTATLSYQGITLPGGYISISCYNFMPAYQSGPAYPDGKITAMLKYYKDKDTFLANPYDSNLPLPDSAGLNIISVAYVPGTDPLATLTTLIETWFPDAVPG